MADYDHGRLPPLPGHPRPHEMRWTDAELRTIQSYGHACYALALVGRKPLAVNPSADFLKGKHMHYRNGREAKNGDKIVKLEGGKIVAYGVLHSAVPGNDYCNGNIAVVQSANDYACLVDCLHVDDVAQMLAERDLAKRPEGT